MVKSYTEVWEVLNPCLQGGMGLMSEFNDKACKQPAFAAHHLTLAFNIVKWYAQYTINPQFNYTLCITYVNLCSFLTPPPWTPHFRFWMIAVLNLSIWVCFKDKALSRPASLCAGSGKYPRFAGPCGPQKYLIPNRT